MGAGRLTRQPTTKGRCTICGIFGYISKRGERPNMRLLKVIAAQTERRGNHAYGFAWINGDEQIKAFKAPGAITRNLDDLDAVAGATVVIGHCRWATHGSPEDNRNNHPHDAGRGMFVHNGVIYNYQQLLSQYGLRPKTECDSEVLGLLLARVKGSLHRRWATVAAEAMGGMAVLGLWARPQRLVMVRRGNPLHFAETKAGFYFGSLTDGLPGTTYQFVDGHAAVMTRHATGIGYDEAAVHIVPPNMDLWTRS